MRVFGGILRGRRLQTCRVASLRPTSEKIREAIFNILDPLLTEGSVLDLFAGTGSLGIEALSRGMDRVVFVEQNATVVSFLKKNIRHCHVEDKSEIIRLPVSKGIKVLKLRNEKFALIFLDPPYQEKLAGKTLWEINEAQLITQDGLIIAEHSSQEILEESYGRLQMNDQRTYGQTLVSFFSL
ncbi:MAG TPA: 16S rRNA (guanine(966)-N(2))-methyltransferase RsmD [Thermodesulfobacteriota bacterium]|nr:16S rRNA (guanine(966)-N(2))-methyltransferase RsmD [Thermodesulfobacteriota bacterium]